MEAHPVRNGSTDAHPSDADYLEYPPPGRGSLVGPRGFGVVVKGESMAGRGIHDGDVVWVNPDRPYAVGSVVLALVSDVDGESGMVVYTFGHIGDSDCLMSETRHGRTTLRCREFKVIGPLVGRTSWHPIDPLQLLSVGTAPSHQGGRDTAAQQPAL